MVIVSSLEDERMVDCVTNKFEPRVNFGSQVLTQFLFVEIETLIDCSTRLTLSTCTFYFSKS